MKRKKKNVSSSIDIIYISTLLIFLIILLTTNSSDKQSFSSSNDSDASAINEPVTYYLYDESGTNIESWILIAPDNLWVNSNGESGAYSLQSGTFTFFLNNERLCSARIEDETLAVTLSDNSLIRYRLKACANTYSDRDGR